MTRILIIDNSIGHTGATEALFKAISSIPQGEFIYTFVFPVGSIGVETAESFGYNAFAIPIVEISRRRKDIFSYLPSLWKNSNLLLSYIKKNNVKVVHVNDMYNLLGIVLKIRFQIPLITHIRRMPHSFPKHLYKAWVKIHCLYADMILANSEATKKEFTGCKRHVEVVYDPPPNDEILPSYIPRPLLDKSASLLFLANYTDGKGHLHALQVLIRAMKEIPDFSLHLNIYGSDFGIKKNAAYKQFLVDFALSNGISGNVTFHGSTRDIEKEMKQHDILLNFSDSESFSRVTMEGLFYGIPTIATDAGGTNEMVINELTGLLVPIKDIDAMFNSLKLLLLNDRLRVRVSANGYDYIRKHFGLETSVIPIIKAYKQLANS